MCGILGFNWKDEKLAKKLGKCVKHRGPDQEGYYSDEKVSLGHKRLSIIDLSEKGIQPMWDQEQRYAITYNGEIFNFQEIREELENRYKFVSKTDTEVIIYGYEEWGHKVLDKLNGQFSLCIYDKKEEELFLARDRIGINPLYYYWDNEKFVFGSEYKILMEAGIPKEINKFSLNYYLLYGHTPREQTILKNAYKLRPGHYIKFDLKNNRIKSHRKYWDVELTSEIKDEEEAISLIREQLDKTVKKRLVADVPVGAFLSGGVDSSAVVAYMSKYTDELNTFSVKFDYDDFDESKYAELVSEKFNTNHHVIEFAAEDVKELIPKLAYHYDEPFGDPSMIPTYLVSKVARENVTVSLSGDGGDELFGGYNSYKYYRLLQPQNYYPKFVNEIAKKIIHPLNLEVLTKPKIFFEIGTLDRKNKFAALMSYLSPSKAEKLIGEDPEKYYEEYGKEFEKNHWLNEATNVDMHNYLCEDILTKVDRASLANSLESRPPFLDHKMIELASKISPELKMKGGESKYILKKALEEVLPDEILYREKQGFGVPLKHYFRNELKDLVEEYVINYDKHNYIQEEYINTIKNQLEKDRWERDYSRAIWNIMMFNMWWEEWMY